jgi:PAS domain S-box-containing protein
LRRGNLLKKLEKQRLSNMKKRRLIMSEEPSYNGLIKKRRHYERLLNTIPCAVYDYILFPDGRNRFLYFSPQCERIFELSAETIMADPNMIWEMVHPDDAEQLQQEDVNANRAQIAFQSEVRIVLPGGRIKWIHLWSMPSSQKYDSQTIWSGVILDVTKRKEAEEEKNRLVNELKTALDEIKTLKGIVPICSFCKKIRDDKGYWEQVEVYVAEHTDAAFSHSFCPECAKKHYPDFKYPYK